METFAAITVAMADLVFMAFLILSVNPAYSVFPCVRVSVEHSCAS